MTRNKELPAAELEKRSARFMELFMRGPSGCCNWPWGTGTPRPFHAAVRGRLPGWSPYGALRADAAGSLPARLPATDTIRRICDARPLDAVIADMPGWEDEIRAIRDTLRKSAVPWWAFARKDSPLRWVWCSVEPVHAKAEPSFLVLELAPELDDVADLPALLALAERMDPPKKSASRPAGSPSSRATSGRCHQKKSSRPPSCSTATRTSAPSTPHSPSPPSAMSARDFGGKLPDTRQRIQKEIPNEKQ